MLCQPFKPVLIPFFLVFFIVQVSCTDRGSDLDTLNRILDLRQENKLRKLDRVALLTGKILAESDSVSEQAYWNYNRLYDEYILFKFDSAYHYSLKLSRIASRINDDRYLADAKVKYCQALYNAGYIREALDSLSALPLTSAVPDSILSDYYILLGRIYHALGQSTHIAHYSDEYNRLGNLYLDQALRVTADSATFYMVQARIRSSEGNHVEVRRLVLHALDAFPSSGNITSLLYSILAQAEFRLGNMDNTIKYDVLAVENDVSNVTKEGLSLIRIAGILSDQGLFDKASDYLSIALEDAREYGAHQRLKLIETILPITTARQYDIALKNRYLLFALIAVISLGLIVITIALMRTIRQTRMLDRAKRLLLDTNKKLIESNMIKNEYLGHYFVVNSQLSATIDRFARIANRKIAQKDYESLPALIATIPVNKNSIYENLDRIFLKIFPTFVDEFNKLLEPTARIELPEPNSLTPTLRIFALIRLGITDSDNISKILNYSLNTIYNYRTRIRNRAIVEKEKFEDIVKNIGV